MTAGSASIHSGSSAEDGACGIEAHVMLGRPLVMLALAQRLRPGFGQETFSSLTPPDTCRPPTPVDVSK